MYKAFEIKLIVKLVKYISPVYWFERNHEAMKKCGNYEHCTTNKSNAKRGLLQMFQKNKKNEEVKRTLLLNGKQIAVNLVKITKP